MEELAKATTVVDSITTLCLMAEPNNRSTLLHAAAEVGSEEVAKAVIAYTGPANSISPLVNAQDKQGMHEMRVAGALIAAKVSRPFTSQRLLISSLFAISYWKRYRVDLAQ